MTGKEDRFFFGTENDNMDINEYMKKVNNITEYYFESCEKNKKRFYWCCITRIVASALIPVISLASTITLSTVFVSILAGVIVVSESYANISKSYEKWTKYRETCNLLWIEQRRFSMKVGEYADENKRIEFFVTRCEEIMSQETVEWKKYIERVKDVKI